MKMSPQRYALLRDTIRAVVDHIGADACREYAASANPVRMMWTLHSQACNQLQYDDTHPLYQNGRWVRLVPPVPDFRTYNDGGQVLNDTHIATALRRIVRELGLTQ